MIDLVASLRERLALSIAAIIAVELLGAPAVSAHWTLISGPGADVRKGVAEGASFGVKIHYEDLRDLLEGAATLRACLIDGRIELEGDLGKAMVVLPKVFSPSAR